MSHLYDDRQQLMHKNLDALEPLSWTEGEMSFAVELQKTLSNAPNVNEYFEISD